MSERRTDEVISNLDSPQGLASRPEGGLYLAEAGTTQTAGPRTPSGGYLV